MRRVILAVSVAVLAAAVALLFHFRGLQGVGAAGQGTGQGSAKITYLLRLEVEGAGRLLVNGSSQSIVESTRPFTALVEAVPDACYVLRRLLVNGTPVEGSRVLLEVGGNTTVRAVFERPVYTVMIEGNATGAGVEVNGTEHSLPALLTVKACEVLTVTPVAPPRYYPLNGSLTINVTGDARLRLLFRRWLVKLSLQNLAYPARVNNALYNGSAELELAAGSVRVETLRARCLLHNDTHLVCPAGWLARLVDWSLNGTTELELPGNFTLNLLGDTVLEQRVSYLKLRDPVVRVQVQTPSGPFTARAIPGSRWVGEYIAWIYSGKVEAVEGGWLKLEGHAVIAFLELPKGWGRVRVYAKRVSPLGSKDTYIEVVLRNDVVYHSFGVALPPTCFSRGAGYDRLESYTVLTIDSGVMDLGGRCIICSWLLDEAKKFFRVEQAWCNTEPECCKVEWSESGPGTKTFSDVEAGWLHIATEGTLLIKVEVVEWRR
ncbi:MAG: hypothetical protein QXF90_02755 [Thermofilaceae archaeon]